MLVPREALNPQVIAPFRLERTRNVFLTVQRLHVVGIVIVLVYGNRTRNKTKRKKLVRRTSSLEPRRIARDQQATELVTLNVNVAEVEKLFLIRHSVCVKLKQRSAVHQPRGNGVVPIAKLRLPVVKHGKVGVLIRNVRVSVTVYDKVRHTRKSSDKAQDCGIKHVAHHVGAKLLPDDDTCDTRILKNPVKLSRVHQDFGSTRRDLHHSIGNHRERNLRNVTRAVSITAPDEAAQSLPLSNFRVIAQMIATPQDDCALRSLVE